MTDTTPLIDALDRGCARLQEEADRVYTLLWDASPCEEPEDDEVFLPDPVLAVQQECSALKIREQLLPALRECRTVAHARCLLATFAGETAFPPTRTLLASLLRQDGLFAEEASTPGLQAR